MRKKYTWALFVCVINALCISAQEDVNLSFIEKIKQEEEQHSQVMNIAFRLTDSSGPRLTGSPGFMRAANYAKQQLADWGLMNAMLDPWGDFGKSWELEKSYVALTVPYYKPINAFPKAWCGGTNVHKIQVFFLSHQKTPLGLMRSGANLQEKF